MIPRICVYAIAKNEAHFIPRFCESAKDADLILIADTGSDDGLPKIAKQHGVQVHEICISPWRFDIARNAAMSLIPKDIDICVSLDIDEVLQHGWREEILKVWNSETTRIQFMYDWGKGFKFIHNKIHSRHGYRWKHPCHEYLVPDGRINEVWAETDMTLIVHKPDFNKSRGQYLDLMAISVQEDPSSSSTAFFHALELSANSKWIEAIHACQRYLTLPQTEWPNERAYAYRIIGRSYEELNDYVNAEINFLKGCSEAPLTREPWCALSRFYYNLQKWSECYAMACKTLAITYREQVYTSDPEVWSYLPHDLASISAYHMGMKEISLEQAKLALEQKPDDPRLKANLEAIQKEIN